MNHTPEKWRPLDEPLSSFSKAPGLGSQDKCKWSAFISTCSYCKKDWIHNQICINTYIDIYIGINLIVFNEICIVYYLFFNLLIPICPITPSPFHFLSSHILSPFSEITPEKANENHRYLSVYDLEINLNLLPGISSSHHFRFCKYEVIQVFYKHTGVKLLLKSFLSPPVHIPHKNLRRISGATFPHPASRTPKSRNGLKSGMPW